MTTRFIAVLPADRTNSLATLAAQALCRKQQDDLLLQYIFQLYSSPFIKRYLS